VNSPRDQAVILEELRTTTREGGESDGRDDRRRARAIKYDHNIPRIGRVLIAHGRDAADVAITTTFGPNTLSSFTVWTEEVAQGE
jgi:hypothetical protein